MLYRVTDTIEIDSGVYEAGDDIDLDDGQAAQLIEAGKIVDLADVAADPGIDTALEAAVAALRAAPAAVIQAFAERCAMDPEIRAKLEAAEDADDQAEPEPAGEDPATSAADEVPDRHAILVAAIGELDEEADFTRGGKPKVDALERETGLDDVLAAERDTAWADVEAARASAEGDAA